METIKETKVYLDRLPLNLMIGKKLLEVQKINILK